eukprot:1137800-Pelagomonas_calceolata.AAC.6
MAREALTGPGSGLGAGRTILIPAFRAPWKTCGKGAGTRVCEYTHALTQVWGLGAWAGACQQSQRGLHQHHQQQQQQQHQADGGEVQWAAEQCTRAARMRGMHQGEAPACMVMDNEDEEGEEEDTGAVLQRQGLQVGGMDMHYLRWCGWVEWRCTTAAVVQMNCAMVRMICAVMQTHDAEVQRQRLQGAGLSMHSLLWCTCTMWCSVLCCGANAQCCSAEVGSAGGWHGHTPGCCAHALCCGASAQCCSAEVGSAGGWRGHQYWSNTGGRGGRRGNMRMCYAYCPSVSVCGWRNGNDGRKHADFTYME